jgi:hypothetical protein
MTHDEIGDAILQVDESRLTADKVSKLLMFAPSSEDIQSVSSYDGPETNLGEVEHFFLILSRIKAIQRRLQLWEFKYRFDELVEELDSKVDAVRWAYHELKASTRFKTVLETILAVGNFLNAGTRKGAAYGFRLGSLSGLTGTKSVDNSMNLLQYIVQFTQKSNPDAANWLDDLKHIGEARRVEQSALQAEVNQIKAKMHLLETHLKLAPSNDRDKFIDVFRPWHAEARERVEDLILRHEELTKGVASLIDEWAEDLKWESFFEILHKFQNDWKNAALQLSHLEKEKARAQKSQSMVTSKKPAMTKDVSQQQLASVMGKLIGGEALGELAARRAKRGGH